MFSWDEKSIEWFSSSAKQTSFHKSIAKKIIPHLKKEDTLLSLGSGLGFLERELSPYLDNMTLVDNNEIAVEYLRLNKLDNQIIIKEDWKNINIKADYLLLSFFSRMYKEDTLLSLLQLTNKKIFYIINERRSKLEEVIYYLDEKQINYSFEKMNLDFNQVLKSDEISSYLSKYYSNLSELKREKLLKEFKKLDDKHVIFKNRKKIVLFIINKE